MNISHTKEKMTGIMYISLCLYHYRLYCRRSCNCFTRRGCGKPWIHLWKQLLSSALNTFLDFSHILNRDTFRMFQICNQFIKFDFTKRTFGKTVLDNLTSNLWSHLFDVRKIRIGGGSLSIRINLTFLFHYFQRYSSFFHILLNGFFFYFCLTQTSFSTSHLTDASRTVPRALRNDLQIQTRHMKHKTTRITTQEISWCFAHMTKILMRIGWRAHT